MTRHTTVPVRAACALTLALLCSCAQPRPTPAADDAASGTLQTSTTTSAVAIGAASPTIVLAPELGRHFDTAGVRGAVALYDVRSGRIVTNDTTRLRTRFIPASTFKIFNSLVGLESGVLADEHVVFRWDGTDRGSSGWNADQDLETAFARSTVWYYQELARRIGPERMREWIERAGYGNMTIDGGIDRFWLEGALRISMLEQLEMLRRLESGTLPFSARTQQIVRRVMVRDTVDGVVTSGKTGWAQPSAATPVSIGWWVGWVRRGDDLVFFATNLETADTTKNIGPIRRTITEAAMRDLGMLR